MAFTIKDPPEWSTEITQWDQNTFADGSEMAKVPEALLNNEVWLKKEKERLENVTEVTLTAAGWTGDAAPYSQTVYVSGATADMEPLVVSALADGASAETQKAYVKAFGILCGGTAVLADGQATFKVYKKPATDITIGLKGV